MRQVTLAGVGVARLGLFHVADAIKAGQLVPLLEKYNPGDLEMIHAVYLGGGQVPGRVRAFILVGGTHVFKCNGVLYNIEHGSFFRMPGGVVHEAWLPAGSQTFNILESGWAVNWVSGGPSEEDMDQFPPSTAR